MLINRLIFIILVQKISQKEFLVDKLTSQAISLIIREMFAQDVNRIIEYQQLKGLSLISLLWLPNFWAMLVYRWGNFFTRLNVPIIKHIGLLLYIPMKICMEITWGISISRKAEIGTRLFINHFSGIFVHATAKLGADCIISQGVTIGVKGDAFSKGPTIGDNVKIAAGAKVLGEIKVGNNAIIGANAVVVKDVEENWIVGGVPAKYIKDNKPAKSDNKPVKKACNL